MKRIEGYFRWIDFSHTNKSYNSLKYAWLREQAMNIVSRNLKIFIKERRLENVQEMSDLAEQYLEVHGNTYKFASTDNKPRQNQDNYLKNK